MQSEQNMASKAISRKRVVLAFVVAVIADAIQLPLSAAYLTGFLSIFAFFSILFVDVVAMGLTMGLIGFHWLLLPSFVTELIPGLDLMPTWTACVAWVVFSRRKQTPQESPGSRVIDVEAVPIADKPPLLTAHVPNQQ